ncbi:unnamed protein product [Soboliphyme baturini]|uniref:Uncharacterized protein n=1 Tax=Soboliphyme baturini TaxID=241478 RepID=A0A183IPC2_9BILA|nr:unnamed protein product [Soboliphyme baturini]
MSKPSVALGLAFDGAGHGTEAEAVEMELRRRIFKRGLMNTEMGNLKFDHREVLSWTALTQESAVAGLRADTVSFCRARVDLPTSLIVRSIDRSVTDKREDGTTGFLVDAALPLRLYTSTVHRYIAGVFSISAFYRATVLEHLLYFSSEIMRPVMRTASREPFTQLLDNASFTARQAAVFHNVSFRRKALTDDSSPFCAVQRKNRRTRRLSRGAWRLLEANRLSVPASTTTTTSMSVPSLHPLCRRYSADDRFFKFWYAFAFGSNALTV